MDPLTLILVVLLIIWLTGVALVPSATVHVLLVVILVIVLLKYFR